MDCAIAHPTECRSRRSIRDVFTLGERAPEVRHWIEGPFLAPLWPTSPMMLRSAEHQSQLSLQSQPATSNPQSEQSKRKRFHLLPSLLRNRSAPWRAGAWPSKHASFEMLNDHSPGKAFPITDSCLIPGSPISPRVKNFNSDMRCLALSRIDNPYISQQIERSNSISTDHPSDYALSTPILSTRQHRSSYRNYCSPKKPNVAELVLDLKAQVELDKFNLHDKLIRSPPPNFPEKISQFIFDESLLLAQSEEEDLVM